MVRQLTFDKPVEGTLTGTGERVTVIGTRGSNLRVIDSQGRESTRSTSDVNLQPTTQKQAQDIRDKLSISSKGVTIPEREAVATDISGRRIPREEAQVGSVSRVPREQTQFFSSAGPRELARARGEATIPVADALGGGVIFSTIADAPSSRATELELFSSRADIGQIETARQSRETFFETRARQRAEFKPTVVPETKVLFTPASEVFPKAAEAERPAPPQSQFLEGIRRGQESAKIKRERLDQPGVASNVIGELADVTLLDVALVGGGFAVSRVARTGVKLTAFRGGGIGTETVTVRPTVTQTATLTKLDLIPRGETLVGTGRGRIITSAGGKQVRSNVIFEVSGVQLPEGTRVVARGTIQTGRTGQGFISQSVGKQVSPVRSTAIVDTRILDQVGGRIVGGGETVGAFRVQKIADVTIRGRQRQAFDIRGAVGTRSGRDTAIGIQSGAAEINIIRPTADLGGLGSGTKVKTRTTGPVGANILETLKPTAREQALPGLGLDQSIVRLPNAFSGRPLRQVGRSPTRAAPGLGFDVPRVATGRDRIINVNILTGRAPTQGRRGRRAATAPRIVSGGLSLKGVFNIGAVGTTQRSLLNLGATTRPTTSTKQRAAVRSRVTQRQIFNVSVVQAGAVSPVGIGRPFIIGGALKFGLPFGETQRRKKKTTEKKKGKKRRTRFTPQFAAVALDITGPTPKTTTGLEFRPQIPRRRVSKRKRKK